jgi:hypothetical protein
VRESRKAQNVEYSVPVMTTAIIVAMVARRPAGLNPQVQPAESWGNIHRVRRVLPVAPVLTLLALVACGAGDARAGRPALLATVRDRVVLLDGTGRIERRLPSTWSELTSVCPGGRRLVAAPDFSGFVEARTLSGRRLWRTRTPVASVQQVGCSDGRARRAAVVLGIDRVKSLHIVGRHSDRRARRFRGEVLALEPRRMYWRDGALHVDALPSARPVASYAVPDNVHAVYRSPDGRHLALQAWNDPLGAPELKYLLDTSTGAVRPIDGPELQLEGWRADGRLIARTPGTRLALDPALQVRARIPLHARQVLVAGSRIFAVDGRVLSIVTARGPRRVGTVPRETQLLAAL